MTTLILVALLWTCSWLASSIHETLLQRSRPDISTPEKAPHPVSMFEPAKKQQAEVSFEGGKEWSYQWSYTTDHKVHDVLSYYDTVYPNTFDAKSSDPDDPNAIETPKRFLVHPAGAPEADQIEIMVGGTEDGATFVIRETYTATSMVPSYWTIKYGLWGLLLLGWIGVRARFAEQLAKNLFSKRMAEGGTRYTLMPGFTDKSIVDGWATWERQLATQGFEKLVDYQQNVDMKNASRTYHKEHQLFATLTYVDAKAAGVAHFCELYTRFNDGSTVTTSNSKFSSNFKRPLQYPLIRMRDVALNDLFMRHEAQVNEWLAGGRTVVSIGSADELFEGWREVERKMFEFRKNEGFLTDDAAKKVQQTGSMGVVDSTSPPPPPPPVWNAGGPPAAAAPPPPVWNPAGPAAGAASAVAVAPDEKAAFQAEVVAALQQGIPDVQVADGEHPLSVRAQRGNRYDVLDMETLYYMCRNAPDNRDKLIASFVNNARNQLQ